MSFGDEIIRDVRRGFDYNLEFIDKSLERWILHSRCRFGNWFKRVGLWDAIDLKLIMMLRWCSMVEIQRGLRLLQVGIVTKAVLGAGTAWRDWESIALVGVSLSGGLRCSLYLVGCCRSALVL